MEATANAILELESQQEELERYELEVNRKRIIELVLANKEFTLVLNKLAHVCYQIARVNFVVYHLLNPFFFPVENRAG